MIGALVQTIDGKFGKIVNEYINGEKAQIEFRAGKGKAWLRPSEFKIVVPVPPDKSRLTDAEACRCLSKYCTNYKQYQDKLNLPFDPNRSPEVLALFESRVLPSAVLYIGSSPTALPRVVSELAAAGLDGPSDYVHLFSSESHDDKFDLFVADPCIPDVDFTLGMFFNPRKLAATGRYQISRKDYILSVLLRVRVLEIGEAVPELD